MCTPDIKFVIKADKELIEQDIPLYARPLNVVIKWQQEKRVIGDILSPEIWKPLMQIYKELYPSGSFSLPPLLTGGVLLRDSIYLVNVNIGYGTFIIDPCKCINISAEELKIIFYQDHKQVGCAIYSVLDLWDFAYGVDDLRGLSQEADQLWNNAMSSINSMALLLSNAHNIDTAVQNICLSAELSLKGALAFLGISENKRRKLGHNIVMLVDTLVSLCSFSSDTLLKNIAAVFPDYAQTRYEDHGLSRMQLMELCIKSQFIAAEALRRISNRNLANQVENDIKLNYGVCYLNRFNQC